MCEVVSAKVIADVREHEQSRVAVLEDGRLMEIFIEYNCDEDGTLSATGSKSVRHGDIYLARVEALVPAINAAFVKLSPKTSSSPKSLGNAFMYVNEAKSPTSIRPGHELIVQVIRSARKNKAPRVTPRLSIPGRWLVLVPNSDEAGISHRITSTAERKRLKVLAETLRDELRTHGVIIRTAAEGISEEYLRSDLVQLIDLWDDITGRAKRVHAPCLLYRDLGTLGRVLRDDVIGKVDEIIVDDADAYEAAKFFTERFCIDRPHITLYDGTTPVFEYFGIEDEIGKALDRKVWLKSGAYLVIDQTEALTVIDVNTGKFTSAPDMKHTILATNKEAAEEIARQLRLRAIGGIVIVDFIDMDNDADKHELLRHFQKFLSHDRLKAHIFSLTQLGLVELTRKRERPDLKTVLTHNCPVCGDNGFVERLENIAVSIKRFIRKVTASNGAEAFLIETDNHAGEYVSHMLGMWQEEFGRRIIVAGMRDFQRGKFRLEFQGNIDEALRRAEDLRANNKGHVIIYSVG